MQGRTLVVGDIHGAYRALLQCLERCAYDPTKDKIIFLGDYVDGWSESAEVIQKLIELKEENPYNIFIRGNHDKWWGDWLIKGHSHPIWLAHGGTATVESYIRTGHVTDKAHKIFYENLIDFYVDEENRGFVHGGYTSGKGLGKEPYRGNYFFDRDLWNIALLQHGRPGSMTPARENDKATRYLAHKEIFVGHTPTVNYEDEEGEPIVSPMNKCNVWDVDTGAGFSGCLTIMDIDTKEYWQSNPCKDLYPDERGRN